MIDRGTLLHSKYALDCTSCSNAKLNYCSSAKEPEQQVILCD